MSSTQDFLQLLHYQNVLTKFRSAPSPLLANEPADPSLFSLIQSSIFQRSILSTLLDVRLQALHWLQSMGSLNTYPRVLFPDKSTTSNSPADLQKPLNPEPKLLPEIPESEPLLRESLVPESLIPEIPEPNPLISEVQFLNPEYQPLNLEPLPFDPNTFSECLSVQETEARSEDTSSDSKTQTIKNDLDKDKLSQLYSCLMEGCGAKFKRAVSLKRHTQRHASGRPFLCTVPECGKKFSWMSSFKRHLRIHSGEKPFTCRVLDCGKSFGDYSNWRRHEAIHKGTSWKCPIESCGRTYSRRDTLQRHIAYHEEEDAIKKEELSLIED